MSLLEQIDKARVPQHIAIIMDGNGRWAKKQGLDRCYGHRAGIDSLHNVIEAARYAGVKYLTAYTFSTENWNRPQHEVDTLMGLICFGLEREMPGMLANGVQLHVVGDKKRLPADVNARLQKCIDDTAHCQTIIVTVAISYSARWEITEAARNLAQMVADGQLSPADINENLFASQLTMPNVPDPDLLIRTGGEERISNYLLWQIAYSELYFTDTYWPEFSADCLYEAILAYQHRERRFGKTSEQVQNPK